MAKAQEDGKDLYPDEEGPPEPAEDGGAAPAKRPPGTKKRPTAKVKKSAAKKSAASRGSKRGARPKAGGGAAPRADAPQIEELDGGADDIEVDLTVHIQASRVARFPPPPVVCVAALLSPPALVSSSPGGEESPRPARVPYAVGRRAREGRPKEGDRVRRVSDV